MSLDDAHFLPVSGGVVAVAAVEIEPEPLGQCVGATVGLRSAQPAEELQQLAAGHVRIEREVRRQVADTAPDGDRIPVGIETEQARAAARRVQEIEQRADRRALARTVRPEKPEHLARAHLEVEVDDPGHRRPWIAAVVLRQALGHDHRSHAR